MVHEVGTRIRARRLDRGIRQADLAQAAGISPSYLNLIEHNKRRIASDVLERVAEALDVPAELLFDGADPRVLDGMRTAAGAPDVAPELAKTEELAALYPGWAALIADQQARIAALETRTQVLTDRITYDPAVATALHGMISAVTAIRSTASILTSGESLDADWLSRFHTNINEDARRLAADSEALIGYLDAPEDAGTVPVSPLEEAENWMARRGWHLAELEAGDADAIAPMLAASDLRKAAQSVVEDFARVYVRDATALPLPQLEAGIAANGLDAWVLARELDQPLDRVLRRMANLPPDVHPPLGLVVCDAGGFPLVIKEVPGLTFPRGSACPLWPVYQALGQPDRPIQRIVSIPGQPETEAFCTAVARQRGPRGPDQVPEVHAFMLVQPNPPTSASATSPIPVGTGCRICPRHTCDARREPSALSQE